MKIDANSQSNNKLTINEDNILRLNKHLEMIQH